MAEAMPSRQKFSHRLTWPGMCRLHLRIRANRVAFPWQHITLKGARDAALGGRLALIYRLLQLRWGATHEDVMRAMPGDDIQQNRSSTLRVPSPSARDREKFGRG
jgi:hypothetical protein